MRSSGREEAFRSEAVDRRQRPTEGRQWNATTLRCWCGRCPKRCVGSVRVADAVFKLNRSRKPSLLSVCELGCERNSLLRAVHQSVAITRALLPFAILTSLHCNPARVRARGTPLPACQDIFLDSKAPIADADKVSSWTVHFVQTVLKNSVPNCDVFTVNFQSRRKEQKQKPPSRCLTLSFDSNTFTTKLYAAATA